MTTGRPIRVLVIDDSVVVRKVVSDSLKTDPAIVVVASARDGKAGLEMIEQLKPDVVTLDVAMPVMDGLATLKEIRKLYPKLPVIMFSSYTGDGAAATIEALALGASDCARKPDTAENLFGSLEAIRAELIPKIKALCGPAGGAGASTRPGSPQQARPARSISSSAVPIRIVVIGASTGGPNALAEMLPGLEPTLPVPILIVQHMPATFTKLLADRLAQTCSIPVCEAMAGQTVLPGCCYIAPGNFHMAVEKTLAGMRIKLNQEPMENSCRPAVDVLFRSAATAYKAGVLGVVMTGMGMDGLAGSRCIREIGGQVIVQDQASSVIWGMPGQVVSSGQADGVFSLSRLAPEITRRTFRRADPMFKAAASQVCS